jgi:hypothetical protein
MNLGEIGCEDGLWMKLVQNLVQLLAFVLLELNFQFCYDNVSYI